MGLKITKKAPVNEHFVALMFKIYQRWFDTQMQNAETYPGGRQAYLKNYKHRLARVHGLLHGADGDGRFGKTYEITKLRALPYTAFGAVRYAGVNYLMAETAPITIELSERNRRGVNPGVYHLGPYRVYVAESTILDGRLDMIHMIPLKAPSTLNRFMHHRASNPHEARHPLEYTCHTCWGAFPEHIRGFAEDADIPELFRGLFLYLSRYDVNSPLVDITRMGWDVTTPWEIYHAD